MSDKPIFNEILSRRNFLKYGLYSGLSASLASSLYLSGCRAKKDKDDNPNVILISIDTLRSDHLGCYGYERNTSPYIDSFAKQNILFRTSLLS